MSRRPWARFVALTTLPVALSMSMSTPARADLIPSVPGVGVGGTPRTDEALDIAGGVVALVGDAAITWEQYALGQTTDAIEEATLAEQLYLDSLLGSGTDPDVVVPLGTDASAEAGRPFYTPADDGGGGPSTTQYLYDYDATTRHTGDNFVTPWVTVPYGESWLTIRSHVCNDPDNRHGQYVYFLERTDGKRSKGIDHQCFNYGTGRTYWVDGAPVGSGDFVKGGWSYRMVIGFLPNCTGEGAPVSDTGGGPHGSVLPGSDGENPPQGHECDYYHLTLSLESD